MQNLLFLVTGKGVHGWFPLLTSVFWVAVTGEEVHGWFPLLSSVFWFVVTGKGLLRNSWTFLLCSVRVLAVQ